MARETQTKTLKDSAGVERTVRVDQLPAMRAWMVLRDVIEALAPAAGQVLKGGGSIDLANLDVSMLGGAIEALFRTMTREKFERLTKDLLSGVTVDARDMSNEALFNATFRGEMLLLTQVLGFSLQVNYSDFSGGLGEQGRNLMAKAFTSGASSTSPGPSIG